MSIDQLDRDGIYRLGDQDGDEHGNRNEGSDLLLVRALRPSLECQGGGRPAPEGVSEPHLQESVLGSAASGRGADPGPRGRQKAPQAEVARRGPLRVR